MAWYDYPITQAHGVNGEQGVDYGTPYHTPLTALLAGIVQRVLCDIGWRCEVDITAQLDGQQVTESFLHVDQPAVRPGQAVSLGSLIGLSGGQTSGGSNPDDPRYSSGPHVEFDIFRGPAWTNPVDPTAFVASFAGAGGDQGNVLLLSPGRGLPNDNPRLKPGGSPDPNLGLPNPFQGLGDIGGGIATAGAELGGAIAGLPGDVGHGIANAAAGIWENSRTFLARNLVALVVAAAVVVVLFL